VRVTSLRSRFGSGVAGFLTQGGGPFFCMDERSHSDRTRPQDVLGVGSGGGRPFPHGGSGVITPEKKLKLEIAVCAFLVH
jgi:hypothetical protein